MISLVIPCYNEAKGLLELAQRCLPLVEKGNVEVIFVNNGSTDNSKEVFSKIIPLHNRFILVEVEQNQGYGFGILSGLKVARGDYLGWTHADLQTDPLDVLKAVPFIQETKNELFIKGNRRGRPLSDTVFTLGMSVFETVLLRKRLWDINAQPTLFSKQFFESWVSPPSDFSLDLYAYYMAREKKVTIKRIKVFFGKRKYGTSHWNINWEAKRKFIKRTIDFSFKLLKGGLS